MSYSDKFCPNCKNGTLEIKMVNQYLSIDGAPEFKVENFPVLVCIDCAYEIMSLSESEKLDKLFLELLIQYYSRKPWDVIGKVASWIRKVVGITARELAGLARIEESTISHTFKKNTALDRFAATILLIKARDFLNGTTESDEIIKRLNDPELFFHPRFPVAEIIQKIKNPKVINLGLKPIRRRPLRSTMEKQQNALGSFDYLYKKHAVKNQKLKR
jgi:hypothetical protein